MKKIFYQKSCSKCKIKKLSIEFLKDKKAKDGLCSQCRECNKIAQIKWRNKNKDKIKIYLNGRKEKIREQMKIWREKNTEKMKAYLRIYWGDYSKKRKKIDKKYHLDSNMSGAIGQALKGKKEWKKWRDLVGYDVKNLMQHLESKFDENMSWDNYGSYWWIDHIKPRSLFKYEKPEDEEFKKCWALDNLQPLEKIANMKKSNHYES